MYRGQLINSFACTDCGKTWKHRKHWHSFKFPTCFPWRSDSPWVTYSSYQRLVYTLLSICKHYTPVVTFYNYLFRSVHANISSLPDCLKQQKRHLHARNECLCWFISGSFAHRISRWMADAMDFYQQVGRWEGWNPEIPMVFLIKIWNFLRILWCFYICFSKGHLGKVSWWSDCYL